LTLRDLLDFFPKTVTRSNKWKKFHKNDVIMEKIPIFAFYNGKNSNECA